MPVIRLDTLDQVRALAALVLDPARPDPVVCVSTRHGETDPLVDADALAASVGALPVYVMPTGELTWELTAALPSGLEVYGGAIRIWWPGLHPSDDPYRHPLVFCWAPHDAEASVARVLRELSYRGWDVVGGDDAEGTEPPRPASYTFKRATVPAPVVDVFADFATGQHLEATVVAVFAKGSEVQVAHGVRATIRHPRGSSAPPYAVGETAPVRVVSVNRSQRTVELRWAAEPHAEGKPQAPAAPSVKVTPADVARLYAPRGAPAAPQVPAQRIAADGTDLEAFQAAADDIITTLHDELAAAKTRVKEFADEQFGNIIQAMQAELKGARDEARLLHLQLEAAEKDKRNAIAEMRKHRDRANESEKQAKREHDKRVHAETRFHGYGVHDDQATQLRHEIFVAVQRLSADLGIAAESARHYDFGPDFLETVLMLQGIERPDIVDKIARLLLNAPNSCGHAMRKGEAGNAPQQTRASDGAKAFRVYLQQGTPSARRLHYWHRADGSVELANVGVHDAMAIRR